MKMMTATTYFRENMNGTNQPHHQEEEPDMIDHVFENLTSTTCPLPDDLENVIAHEQQQQQQVSKSSARNLYSLSHRGRKKKNKPIKATATDDVAATAAAIAAATASATASALAVATDAATDVAGKVTSSVMTAIPSTTVDAALSAAAATAGENDTETIVALEAAVADGRLEDNQDALDRLCTPLEKCCLGGGRSSSAAAAAVAVGQTNTIRSSQRTNNNKVGGNVPFVSDEPSINRNEESSLAHITARMKDIDLESATTDINDESSDDQIIGKEENNNTTNNTNPQKNSRRGRRSRSRTNKNKRIRRHSSRGRRNKTSWYSDRMDAALIILCILFTIAIITMTVLLVFA